MKYCKNCGETFFDDMLSCSHCNGELTDFEKLGESEKNKIKHHNDVDMGIRAGKTEIIACVVIFVCAVVNLICHFAFEEKLSLKGEYLNFTLYLPLMDVLFIIAVMFKGWLFRHLTWSALIARSKGIDLKNLYPTPFYRKSIFVGALLWTAGNIIYIVMVLKICL